MDYNNILCNAHTLIAGTTGAGKSTLLNNIIYFAIKNYTPATLRFMFIDLKRVELSAWRGTKYCYKYADNYADAVDVLNNAVSVIERRYNAMQEQHSKQCTLTHIFVVIDELADLLASKNKLIEELICKIGRLGRASNVHLIICTQSPNRSVLKATIQQNITCSIALRCKTAIESRQVLGVAGAEKLPQYGECIVWAGFGFSYEKFDLITEQQILKLVKKIT